MTEQNEKHTACEKFAQHIAFFSKSRMLAQQIYLL